MLLNALNGPITSTPTCGDSSHKSGKAGKGVTRVTEVRNVNRTRRITALGPVLALAVVAACSPGSSGPPLPTRTSALPSAAVSPSLGPQPSGLPALTETFASNVHGISVSYPTGWTPRTATEPWPAGEIVMQQSEFGDIIADDADENRFLALASQPLGEAFDSWAARYLGIENCDPAEPITVDGAPGITGTSCPLALVEADGRGYLIWLYGIPDMEWFRQILATVQLHPDAAIDATQSDAP